VYKKFAVEIKFRSKCLGGLPKTEDLLDRYIEAKFEGAKPNSETHDHVSRDIDTEEKAETDKKTSMNGFRQDEVGIYVGDYQVKAMMKQAGSLLGLTTKKRGTKSTLGEALFVKGMLDSELTGRQLYFQDDSGEVVAEPDGHIDIAGRVWAGGRPQSIINRYDYTEGRTVKFQLWVLKVRLKDKKLNTDDLRDILEFGQEVGLGSGRSQEHGKYDLVKFEEV